MLLLKKQQSLTSFLFTLQYGLYTLSFSYLHNIGLCNRHTGELFYDRLGFIYIELLSFFLKIKPFSRKKIAMGMRNCNLNWIEQIVALKKDS
jgi:hypothetical protein